MPNKLTIQTLIEDKYRGRKIAKRQPQTAVRREVPSCWVTKTVSISENFRKSFGNQIISVIWTPKLKLLNFMPEPDISVFLTGPSIVQ